MLSAPLFANQNQYALNVNDIQVHLRVWTEGCNTTERLSPSVYRACVIDSGQEGKRQSRLSTSQLMADGVVLFDW